MNEKRSLVDRMEIAYLQIFKLVVLVVLTLCLLGAIALVFKAWGGLRVTPEEPPVLTEPNVSADSFVRGLKDTDKREKPAAPQSEKPGAAKDRTSNSSTKLRDLAKEEAVQAQSFFAACVGPGETRSINQERFAEIRLKWLQETWEQPGQGEKAVAQFHALYGNVLKNQEVIEWCQKNLDGLFDDRLPWTWDALTRYFDSQWNAQYKQAREERERFISAQNAKVAEARAEALMELYIAAGALGTFMLLSMILIFARIESNLRDLHALASRTTPTS